MQVIVMDDIKRIHLDSRAHKVTIFTHLIINNGLKTNKKIIFIVIKTNNCTVSIAHFYCLAYPSCLPFIALNDSSDVRLSRSMSRHS